MLHPVEVEAEVAVVGARDVRAQLLKRARHAARTDVGRFPACTLELLAGKAVEEAGCQVGHSYESLPSKQGGAQLQLEAEALAAHIQEFPPTSVTLPWEQADGQPVTAGVLVVSRESKALNRNYINRNIWKPALQLAGIAPTRDQMMHAGRHLYASAQLEAGTSIRAFAEYLGHSDPGFTLRTHTHLMPEAEDKAKRAVDTLFERLDEVADDPLRGPNVPRRPSDRKMCRSEGRQLRCRSTSRTHAGAGAAGSGRSHWRACRRSRSR